MEAILEKLRLTKENPGYFKSLTAEEQAELFLLLLTPKKKVFQKPKIIQGIDGKDYILTEKDKEDIAKSITVPVVEKVIEKTVVEKIREIPGETVIREIPIVTKETVEVAVLDEATVAYLEDEIARVEEKIKEEPRVIYQGGTIGKQQVYGFIKQSIVDFPVTGTTTYAYRAIGAPRTLDITDSQIECTTNSFTVTLPTAVGITGRVYSIKNSGTGIITIATTGGQTIDGKTTQSLTQYDNIKVFSNGANWIII